MIDCWYFGLKSIKLCIPMRRPGISSSCNVPLIKIIDFWGAGVEQTDDDCTLFKHFNAGIGFTEPKPVLLSQISVFLTCILRINEPISRLYTYLNAFLMVIPSIVAKIKSFIIFDNLVKYLNCRLLTPAAW